MNFPKLKKVYIKNVGVVEIRPYLTTAEIDTILQKIQSETTDYALRKMILYSTVMSLCTDIQDFAENEMSLETVELYYFNGVFDRITKHIKGFDILVDGFNNLAILDINERFEGAINEFTKQFKDIDLNKSMNELENKINEFKEVSKEKEAILNG